MQTSGRAGDDRPAWNTNAGGSTFDGAAVWLNLSPPASWQAKTRYTVGQAVIDAKGLIHIVTVSGYIWLSSNLPGPHTCSRPPTPISSLSTLRSAGSTKATSFRGRPDTSTGLGRSSSTPTECCRPSPPEADLAPLSRCGAPIQPSLLPTPIFTRQLITSAPVQFQQLQLAATQPPYIISIPTTVSTPTAPPSEALINANDLTLLTTRGLQPLITSLQARISRANDLIDMAFLTTQTDIYRFRQNVLGATAATTLATSPVLANIAKGETANATSENLQTYYKSLYSPTAAPSTVPAPGTTGDPITYHPSTPFTVEAEAANPVAAAPSESARTRAVTNQASLVNSNLAPSHASIKSAALNAAINTGLRSTIDGAAVNTVVNTGLRSTIDGAAVNTVINTGVRSTIDLKATGLIDKVTLPAATQIINPGVNTAVISTDITAQSPLVGAQLNLRTLGIAERLQQSPSQEAMFYAIANRLGFINSLVALEADLQSLGFVIDDLPVAIDDPTSKPPDPVGILSHTIYDFKLAPRSLPMA